MHRITAVCLIPLLLAVSAVSRADDARWMRYPALSPDGERIAFSYRGDLWMVPATGGEARLLTSHTAHERYPVWSPDGRRIAFSSDRHGNEDVFVMDAEGGAATRLTFHSSDDAPWDFTPDGGSVIFSSRRQDAPESSVPSVYLEELYRVPIAGGRVTQLLTTPAECARFGPGGVVAYHDNKGYENPWRKHHTSSIARDLWTWDPAGGEHVRRTTFSGEDRNPVWAPDGSLWYLSEQGGSFNVWRTTLGEGAAPEQVTRHGPHPVRFLTAARDGTLCYGYHGAIWVKPPDGEPRQVAIEVRPDDRVNPARLATHTEDATEMRVGPEEDEVAFIVRGEVFVASVEHGTTRRITDTPQQERGVCWAPDGRTLYYASERDGSWNVYRSRIARDEEKRFFESTLLTEEPVLADAHETFQPEISPDGRSMAFVQDRDEIRVLDLASGVSRTIVPAARNYSYADGDIRFDWSPDSRWLAFNFLSRRRWIDDLGVAEVATGEIVDVTRSGYQDVAPLWSPDGRALLFRSNRYGRRSHGSWGSEDDVMAFDLTREAQDRAQLTVEEYERLAKHEKEAKEEKKKDGDGDKDAKEPPPVVRVELEGRDHRFRRLTLHSAPMESFAVSPDGETLVYLAQEERKWDLWVSRPRHRESRKLLALGDDSSGEVRFAKDGKSLFLRRGNGAVARVKLNGPDEDPTRGAEIEPVPFAAEMWVQTAAERAHMFEHAWRQAGRKFYDPAMHGVDWEALKGQYEPLVADLATHEDFAELLSEMLGELNASHTGSGHRHRDPDGDRTASLGLLFDTHHRGDGLVVAEVLLRGPADRADSRIAAGSIVTHLDAVALTEAVNTERLLNRKAGRRVRLGLRNPGDGTTWEEVLRPVELGVERNLRHERWVESRRRAAHELSGGRVGYAHVRGMDDASYRDLYQEVLGREGDREALVVDTRFNGGGWLHDHLVIFLGARQYTWFVPRGKQRGDMGGDPFDRWTRPVCVVQSESNYSDAHIFPFAFRELGLGKLVGTPVAGTGTAVWWETLVDPEIYFGIPQVGIQAADGTYLENSELQPDLLVLFDPGAMARGEDPQLEAAVRLMLEEIR